MCSTQDSLVALTRIFNFLYYFVNIANVYMMSFAKGVT